MHASGPHGRLRRRSSKVRSGATGAVGLIQRFGSALNLNIHFHMVVLDGAYLVGTEPLVFRRMAPPGEAESPRSVVPMHCECAAKSP